MNELELIEDRTMRDRMAERVDVLDKVKALALLPDDMNATVEMASSYYEVTENTIKLLIADHKNELRSDGLRTLRGSELEDFVSVLKTLSNNGDCFSSKTRQLTIIPRRALLRVGMLLRDSTVAKTVRTYLLNVEEVARKEAPQIVQKAIQHTKQASWASIEKAVRFKTKLGIGLGMTPSTAQLIAIQDTEREFNVDLTMFKNNLPGDPPEHAMAPTDIGKQLGLSGIKVNELLEKAGLQFKTIKGKKDGKDKWEWQVTDRGKAYAKLVPFTIKNKDGSGVEATKFAIKWYETVVEQIKAAVNQ